MDKYLSIITNFGCHYRCPYCIVKKNNLHIPKTTIEGLSCLRGEITRNKANIISISGGGDPLYQYEQHKDWYDRLFGISDNIFVKYYPSNVCKPEIRPIRIEMHTSYMTDESSFPFEKCYRVVYHANSIERLSHIHRSGNEKTRVVFVVTEEFTVQMVMDIALKVKESDDIDELSFRQLVDGEYKERHYLEDFLRFGHKGLWWYIEQNDYNLYYAENKVYTRYRDFK